MPVRVTVELPWVKVPTLVKCPPTETVPPGAKVWLAGMYSDLAEGTVMAESLAAEIIAVISASALPSAVLMLALVKLQLLSQRVIKRSWNICTLVWFAPVALVTVTPFWVSPSIYRVSTSLAAIVKLVIE